MNPHRATFDQTPIMVRLRILTRLRWIAVVGQLATILIVGFVFQYPFNIVYAFTTVLALALYNVVVSQTMPPSLTDGQAAVQLGFDIFQLAILLYLTGGLLNPFSILLIAPVTIGASSLSRTSAGILTILALGIIALLHYNAMPLPWPGDRMLVIADLYTHAQTLALVIAILFTAFYNYKVAHDNRRQHQAVGALQDSLSRARKMAALGALSAAAAHEMGTPLNSIRLIAQEIKEEAGNSKKLQNDVKELLEQVERCKKILGELSQNPDKIQNAHFDYVRLDQLIEELFTEAVGKKSRIKGRVRVEPGLDKKELKIFRSVELVKSLRNLIQNAVRFAQSEVSVTVGTRGQKLFLMIEDDGPGFSTTILHKLGEPYLGSREGSDHMGLGIFIAQTLLTSLGASITFGNNEQQGAQVSVLLPRRIQRSTETHA